MGNGIKNNTDKRFMKRRLFHLHVKATNKHEYYGSLAAIFLDYQDLGVSKYTLDRYNFEEKEFENDCCVIRKGFMRSAGDIRQIEGKRIICDSII